MDDPSLPCHSPLRASDAFNPTLLPIMTNQRSSPTFVTQNFSHKSHLIDNTEPWLAHVHGITDDDASDDPNDLTPRRDRTYAADAAPTGRPWDHGSIQAPVFTPTFFMPPTSTHGDLISAQDIAEDHAWWRIPPTALNASTLPRHHGPTFRTEDHSVDMNALANPFYDPHYDQLPFPSAYGQREVSHATHPLTIRNLHTRSDLSTYRSHPSVVSSRPSDISSESSFSAGCPSPSPYYDMQLSGKQALPPTPETPSMELADGFSYLNSPHPIEDDDDIVDIGATDEVQAPYTAWSDRPAEHPSIAGSYHYDPLGVTIQPGSSSFCPPLNVASYFTDNGISIDPRVTMPPSLLYRAASQMMPMFHNEAEADGAWEGDRLDSRPGAFQDDLYYGTFQDGVQEFQCSGEEEGPSGLLAPLCPRSKPASRSDDDVVCSSPLTDHNGEPEEAQAELRLEESSDDDYLPSARRASAPSRTARARAAAKKVVTRSTIRRSPMAVAIPDEDIESGDDEPKDTEEQQGVVSLSIRKVIITPAELTLELLPRRTVKTNSWETQLRARRTAKLIHSDKLLSLVHCGKYTKYIHWNKAGDLLLIPDEKKFTEHVMPLYFDADQWLSFKRQNGSFGIRHGFQKVGRKQVATLYNPALTRENDTLWEKVRLLPQMTGVSNTGKPSRTDNKIQDLQKSRDELVAKCAALESTVTERDKELEGLRESIAQLDQRETKKAVNKREGWSKPRKQTFEYTAMPDPTKPAKAADIFPPESPFMHVPVYTTVSDDDGSRDHQQNLFDTAVHLFAGIANPWNPSMFADISADEVATRYNQLQQDATPKGKRKLDSGTSASRSKAVSRYHGQEGCGEGGSSLNEDDPLAERSKKDKGKGRAVDKVISHKRSRQF